MKKFLSILLVALLAVGAGGCGQNTATETQTPTIEATTLDEKTAVVAADSSKTYKENITIGIDAQITTLDPTQKNNVIQNVLYNLTHDTLINYNEETGKYEPGLALS